MHDIFEGVAHYFLLNLLEDLIEKQKSFSFEYLNDQINKCNYGKHDSNKIPNIKPSVLKKKKLKMSAAEMINFCRYL